MQELYESAARTMALRGIGPAAMGGRISILRWIRTHPSTWYVAVGSGAFGRRLTVERHGKLFLMIMRLIRLELLRLTRITRR